MIPSNFNMKGTSSTWTCMPKCMVLGSSVWKLDAKQRHPKWLTLKINVKAIYDWLNFNDLTFVVDMQTHAKYYFSKFSQFDQKKSQRVEFRLCGLENERKSTIWVKFRLPICKSVEKYCLWGSVRCSRCISRRTDVRTFVHIARSHNTVQLRWTV